jgi:hypothetical protein
MTISSGEIVSIGTTSASGGWQVKVAGSNAPLELARTTGDTIERSHLGMEREGTFVGQFKSDATNLWLEASAGALIINTGGGSERMRIDSSGNVGIGTSSPASELEIQSATPEIRIDATSGGGRNYKVHSDGNELYIEGIGSSGSLKIGEDGTYGVSIDLGTGGIEVSDGIYLGGTGTANKLDDYEEGTFTPDVYHESSNNSTFSSVNGEYTKIGNTVTCQIRVDSGTTGTAGSDLVIGGLPFAVNQAQGNMGIGSWGSNPSSQVGNVFGFNPPKLAKGGTSISTQMTFVTIILVYKTN